MSTVSLNLQKSLNGFGVVVQIAIKTTAFGKPPIRMLYTWIASQMWDSVKILIPPSSSDKNLKKIDDV